MKSETIKILIWTILFGMMSLSVLALAVINAAWWHVITALCLACLSYSMYVDNHYGTESVRDYFRNRKNM